MHHLNERLIRTATAQHGIVNRSELSSLGFTNAQIQHRVRSGLLIKRGPNVYVLPGVSDTAESELRILVADIGGDVWVSGPTAAALFGIDSFELEQPFHVMVRRGRNIARVGHRIHTTTVMPPGEETEWRGFRTTKVNRVLIDLARDVGPAQLADAVEAAFRDGWSSDASLRARIAAITKPAPLKADKLVMVLDERLRTIGAHSALEREFLGLIERAGLPRPECQQVLSRIDNRLVRVDFRFPGTNVVVEVLGYAFHRTRAQMQHDVRRMNALLADGYVPLQYTYRDVVHDERRMVRELESFLMSRGAA